MPSLLEETEAQEGGGPTAPEGSPGWEPRSAWLPRGPRGWEGLDGCLLCGVCARPAPPHFSACHEGGWGRAPPGAQRRQPGHMGTCPSAKWSRPLPPLPPG